MGCYTANVVGVPDTEYKDEMIAYLSEPENMALLEVMVDAIGLWLADNPGETPIWQDTRGALIAGGMLNDRAACGCLARNESGHKLLQHLHAATDGKATVLMAQVALSHLGFDV